MKKKVFIIAFFIILFFPGNVKAHMVGQPPFFKINGEYSDLYPVPTSSVPEFNLPQDLAKKNHLVGESLEMEMDVNQLPILPEVIDNTQFEWDYGDGEKGVGLKNKHTYKKMGSYFLTIYAKYRTDEPQLIQSTLINVLPDASYQLPKAVIKVNDKESKDPLTDIILVDFKTEIEFDSTGSTAKDGVVSYYWDFGDGKSSNEANPKYQYDLGAVQIFPVLRVKDANGFFADAFVQLDSHENADGANTYIGNGINWSLVGIAGIVLLGIGGIWFAKKQIKK